jgi:hypothetical protein
MSLIQGVGLRRGTYAAVPCITVGGVLADGVAATERS